MQQNHFFIYDMKHHRAKESQNLIFLAQNFRSKKDLLIQTCQHYKNK